MKECKNKDCCRKMAHTLELKMCKECQGEVDGWNCTYCGKCEVKLKSCGHCGEKFKKTTQRNVMIIKQEELLLSYDIVKSIWEYNGAFKDGWEVTSRDIERIKRIFLR